MAFRRYTVANGQMIAQQLTDGTRVGFQRDALGSVVGTVTSAGAVQKTYRYKPYGTTLATTGTGTDPEYLWNGANQYRAGPTSHASHYMVHRHYGASEGRFPTVDRLWPGEPPYAYANASPTNLVDPTGEFPILCAAACATSGVCAAALWWNCRTWQQEGFRSFSDCALKTIRELPTWTKLLCGGGLVGCIACLAKALAALDKARRCKALTIAYHVACPGYNISLHPDTSKCNASDGCGTLAWKAKVWSGCCGARIAVYAAGCPDTTPQVFKHAGDVHNACGFASECAALYVSKCLPAPPVPGFAPGPTFGCPL